MGKSALITRTWAGGASVDGKIGTDSSFKKSKGINHRKKVSSIELHRKYVKESGDIVDSPVHQGVRVPDGSVYFMGDTKLYKRSVEAQGSPAAYSVIAADLIGLRSGVFNRDRQRLYMPTNKTISAMKFGNATFDYNLIDNPSFENTTTPLSGWTGTNGTLTVETSQSYHGSRSARMTRANTTTKPTVSMTVSTALDTSKFYTLGMYVKGTNGNKVQLTGSSTTSPDFTLNGGWQYIELVYKPTSTNQQRVQVMINQNQSAFVFDRVMLNEGNAAKPYFDGSTPGDGDTVYSWTGSVGASKSMKKTVDNNPQFAPDMVGQLLDQKVTNTGSLAYTLPTSIGESAANKITFKPDIEPYVRVGFWVIAKGTGDVTVTLHDQANNIVATKVIPNASLVNGQLNYATFDQQVRLSAKPNPYEYHIHLTVSTGTTTVRTGTAADLSKADFESYADVLLDGEYHPAGQFLQYIVIGNGNYVAVWEPITDAPTKTELDPHRLKLPSEYKVMGFTEHKEYYVVSAYKSVSSDYGGADSGAGSTEGLLGFWDGASRGFAWFIKIESGAFESPFTYNGFVYGYVNGVLHVTSGDVPVPVYEIPGLIDFESNHGHNDDVYLKAPYNGMCVTGNILQMAYPALTANESITPGVYSFGRKTKDYAESIAFDHVPSHGQETVKFDAGNVPASGITYLGRFGKNTFMAWQTLDENGDRRYGIDVLNSNNPVYSSGELSYLDIDNKATYKNKQAVEAIATYTKLPGNSKIEPYYRINGEDALQFGDGSDLEHDEENKQFKLKIPKEYRVIEYGIRLTASTDEEALGSPVVDSTTLIIETNADEGL